MRGVLAPGEGAQSADEQQILLDGRSPSWSVNRSAVSSMAVPAV